MSSCVVRRHVKVCGEGGNRLILLRWTLHDTLPCFYTSPFSLVQAAVTTALSLATSSFCQVHVSIVPPSWATLFSSPSVARATPYALVGVDVDRSLSLLLKVTAQGHGGRVTVGIRGGCPFSLWQRQCGGIGGGWHDERIYSRP